MNDLELHSRLTALADDLAPDADPHAQVAGARWLHRRRQRARLAVAGAAAAVALVAVGVPTAVSTLSAPGGDAAGPSTSSERVRGPADALRAGMARWEDDGTVPDPGAGFPCPDLAARLSELDSRYEFQMATTNPGTLSECSWSTDPTGTGAADGRVDLVLRAVPDLDAASLAARLARYAEVDRCAWTTLFPDLTTNVLRVCEPDGGRTWELIVLDEDGAGAWEVTALVAGGPSGDHDLGAEWVATMWAAVTALDNAGAAPDPTGEDGRRVDRWTGTLDERDATAATLGPMAEALRADLAAGAPVSVPDPAPDAPCPEAADRLSLATGAYELAPDGANADARTSEGCRWSLAGGQTSAADGLSLDLRGDPALTQDELVRQYDGERNRGGCYPSAMPGSVGFSALLLCSGEAGTSWTLTLLADDGIGGWVLTADVGADLPEAFGTGTATLMALREVVVGEQ